MPLARSEWEIEVAVCVGANLVTHSLGAYSGYYKQDYFAPHSAVRTFNTELRGAYGT
jgi:hypothetical protein